MRSEVISIPVSGLCFPYKHFQQFLQLPLTMRNSRFSSAVNDPALLIISTKQRKFHAPFIKGFS